MIAFNKPYMTGLELEYIRQAHANTHLSGDGPFTHRCQREIEILTGTPRAFLTHSCTAALEIAALLCDLRPGDEVIMPSYTFVSTANAFVLRGAVPVFVDIRPDTLNMDERLIESAITSRTRAICVVHYAGVACAMDEILSIAALHDLMVIEDAAQGIMSRYRGRHLGTIGALGTLSFHETKNVISGEGGALLVNKPEFFERAEIIREKGTNRALHFRGEIDKYTWVEPGSSYLPGEITAAFLAAQLEQAKWLTTRRLALWDTYHAWAEAHETAGRIRRPIIPTWCEHNAHMYYLLLPGLDERTQVISDLRRAGVYTVFHYVPLHAAPAGLHLARCAGSLPVTERIGDCLLRMPMWIGLDEFMPQVLDAADAALNKLN